MKEIVIVNVVCTVVGRRIYHRLLNTLTKHLDLSFADLVVESLADVSVEMLSEKVG